MRQLKFGSLFVSCLAITVLTLALFPQLAPARSAAARNTLLFSVPAGEDGVHYRGLDIEDMETTGPQAIAVTADGTIAIADTAGGRLLRYSPSGTKIDAVHIEGAVGISDVAAVGADVVVLDEAAVEPAVFRVTPAGAVLERSPLAGDVATKGLSGITVDDTGAVLAELRGGLEFVSLDGTAAVAKSAGDTFAVTTPSPSNPAADLTRGHLLRNGRQFAEVAVEEMVGSMNVLAVLPTGEVFVLVEEVAFTPAVAVDQRVYRFAADGSLTGVARVPLATQFAYVKHSVAIGPDGTAYALVTRRDGADVVRLGFKQGVKRILPESVQVDDAPASKGGAGVCSISRATIEANCIAFANNRRWYSLNALNGSCSGRGKPSYLGNVAAYYDGVSYDWGGFDTVSTFNTGIAGVKRAGDMNKAQVEACSVGVDCSGFVSRGLGLTTKYTTTTLNNISFVIPRASVGTGDLMIKTGVHSAIVDYTASNGLQIWDCSSYLHRDRVVYHWDTWTRFNLYTPRRYNNMCV